MALSEKELVTKIEILLQEVFNTELSFREISAGYGIADLVLSPAGIQPISVDRLPITHFGTLKFFLNLTRKRYSFDDLATTAPHAPRADIKKYVNFLVNNGYLSHIGNSYRRVDAIDKHHPIQKIVAIEAKLTDYRSGILQAKRYQYFAEQSYLAILERAAKHIDIGMLTASGIGLILFNEETEAIKIIKPKVSHNVKERAYNLFAKEVMLSRMAAASVS